MLVLKRLPGERIWIGDNTFVEVIAVEGRRVRLGIEAPEGVLVLRDELRRSEHDRRKRDDDR